MNSIANEKTNDQIVRILSIETSCDETAISIIEASGGADSPCFKILGNALYSQIDTHSEYGGVYPMLAKREHGKNIVPLLGKAITEAQESLQGTDYNASIRELTGEKKLLIKEILAREDGLYDALITFAESHEIPEVDCIAVTEGPGLEPALWVGISFAKALAIALDKPIVPVNHMEGHIISVLMDESKEANERANKSDNKSADEQKNVAHNAHNDGAKENSTLNFPALALLISGGHTELVLAEKWHQYKVIGQTLDDAIGEAFDKVARLMDLPYPGGPKISKLAAESRSENLAAQIVKETGTKPWNLPRPMLKSGDLNFSFSGLKTAVLYAVKDKLAKLAAGANNTDSEDSAGIKNGADQMLQKEQKLTDILKKTLAEEFENAVTEVLVEKTRRAIEETGAQTLIIGGGVVANVYIREAFKKLASQNGISLFTPSVSLSTDNSVMIGMAGYLRWISGNEKTRILESDTLVELKANGNLGL